MAAHEAPLKTRQEEIAEIWKENTWLYAVGGFLAGVLFFPFLQLAITDIADLLGGLVPEAIGIGVTVLFIDVLYRRREEQRRIKDLQEQLVRDASSLVKDVAVNAVHQMRKHNRAGWLTGDDGLLKGADLWLANLEGADLVGANLKRTDLVGAHLEKVDLWLANLEGAFLSKANLEEANLMGANLERAYLSEANLKGAVLWQVNLEGAYLQDTSFDENTILPDANYDSDTDEYSSKWTPDTDMGRFTDPQHPDFWRSDNERSPAYRDRSKSKYVHF